MIGSFKSRRIIIHAPDGGQYSNQYSSWKELFVLIGEHHYVHLNSVDSEAFVRGCSYLFKTTGFKLSRKYFSHDEYKVTKLKKENCYMDMTAIDVEDIVKWLNNHKDEIYIVDISNTVQLMNVTGATYIEVDKRLLIRAKPFEG